MRRIFFIHSGNETFVKLDCEILGQLAEVTDFWAPRKFPVNMLQYWKGVKSSDIVFCWFASWNSFWALVLAKLLGKRSVLVIGGYDMADLPEAGYGHQRGGIMRWISRWSAGLADCLTTFSCFSQGEAVRNAGLAPDDIEVIPLGVKDPFGHRPETPKERMALTVGKVDFSNLKRKGLEAFVRAAASLPDVQFVVIGAWADAAIDVLRAVACPNLLLAGSVDDDELLDYYRRATVYVQASLHEGFGLSVAEAMLAGCIPVVTAAGALPEVVGDRGIYIPSVEPTALVTGIRRAFDSSTDAAMQARGRILELFPIRKRLESLERLLSLVQVRA